MPVNAITCTETINGNTVQIAGQIPDAKTKNQVALIVSTDVNNVNDNNIVHIDQKTSTTAGKFNFNFTLPQNPADVNYGYIIGTNADVDSYIGTISGGQTDDEEPTTPARTVTCTETVDGNNVQISGQISDANTKNQVSLVVSTDVNNVNENNIVHIDQTTSSTSGTFAFNFTLPQNSGVSSYGYIIGTDADTGTYIGVINIQQGGNEDDDEDDDDDHGGDTDITGTTVTVKYYLGADGVFAQTDADGTSYLFKNGHGDTVTIVRNGNVVDDAEYDAYGNVKNPQNITAYTYANYYYDSHSGMYYLRNRFYDPSIARFISEDPVKDGLNWYAYCSGNPVKYVDPWGLYYLEKDDDGQVYAVIEEGDTLSKIALAEVGDSSAYLKLNYAEPGYLEVGQYVNITGIYNDFYPVPTNISFAKTRHTQGDSGLRDVSDEEVSRRARDKSLSGEERRRYQREEKLRGQRNKQKRQSHYSIQQSQLPYPNTSFAPTPSQSVSNTNMSDSQFWQNVGVGVITIIGIVAGIYYFCYTGDPSIIYQYAR